MPRDVPTAIQQGGRGGQDSSGEAIFLIMYEPWAQKIDLSAVNIDTLSDPDYPNIMSLSTHSKKRDRTGVAMLVVIQRVEEFI